MIRLKQKKERRKQTLKLQEKSLLPHKVQAVKKKNPKIRRKRIQLQKKPPMTKNYEKILN